MEKYLSKAIITPCVVEIFKYSKPHFRDYELTPLELLDRAAVKYANPAKARQNLYRALIALRGIVNANIDVFDTAKMVTLTFRENIKDVRTANYEFKKFVQRLKYEHYPELKYVAVVEFQERGAVHYHLLMNIPYIRKKELEAIWGHGFVDIKRPRNIKNWGAYFAKHGTKASQAGLSQLVGQKKFFCSRGLARPEIIYNVKYEPRAFYLKQEKEFTSLRGEKIIYQQFLRK